MLLETLFSGDLKNALIALALTLPAIILCLTLHELAHGACAYALGDRTAMNAGRLTLDPMAHIDPMGFLCMLLLGFGWAKPVPVNPARFRGNRRWGMALVALAGPLTNFVLGFVCMLLFFALSVLELHGRFASVFVGVVAIFFRYMGLLSVGLGTFNLLPIHPLDGSRILDAFLPLKWHQFLARYQQYLLLALIALMWFGGTRLLIASAQGVVWSAAVAVFRALAGV